MKILLIGEYSRLHNSLKEGLTNLGHEVYILGTGDGFKNYGIDYDISPKFTTKNRFITKSLNAFRKLTSIDLHKVEIAINFKRLIPELRGFDHIQLINSDALETYPHYQIKLYNKLLQNNKQISLLICGDETPIVDYNLTGKLKYSVLSPYLYDRSLEKYFQYSLKYTNESYRRLFEHVLQLSNVLITSDLDYELPMRKMGFTTKFIPNPINTDKLKYIEPVINEKIIIFLGINRLSYLKKGIAYFEEALKIISVKYADKVEIIVTENIPYAEYIKLYDSAHILLDQVYGYDQGYNALEAMAKGKVVFTGAETEFTEHYNLKETVAINAVPDAKQIVDQLSYLIENPEKIIEISKNARSFIEREHSYIKIAEQYLKAWGLK
ncbi:glycosyltransferase [Flavobacterium sp. D11R37]|uniref:glycosyltransferase n=1 Tax=Flavobacterium coralii TaxID=2838017 RepID=UPI001CA66002|nr:glycosyltransferase [Flavobacterium coralii]MBY8963900.1 glycosyltransferase [Flavobacterium coralii]